MTSSPVYQIDRVVVAEHAERARSPPTVGVDVVDVGLYAVRGERVEVVREIQRVLLLVRRRDAAVVLCRDHEHPASGLGPGAVGERLALRGRVVRVLEPDLDLIPGARTGHVSAHQVVVDVATVAVALSARGLGGRRRLDGAAVDAVLQRHRSQAPLRDHLDRLRVAVRDAELEVAERVARLLRIEACRLEVERLHRRADRVGGIERRAREPERERQVLLELGLHERLVVGEDEAAPDTALGELGRPAQRAGLRVRVVVGRSVGRVEVRANAGVEPLDRRVRVGAGVLDEQRVVEGGRLDLPAVRVQQQRAVRVVGRRGT